MLTALSWYHTLAWTSLEDERDTRVSSASLLAAWTLWRTACLLVSLVTATCSHSAARPATSSFLQPPSDAMPWHTLEAYLRTPADLWCVVCSTYSCSEWCTCSDAPFLTSPRIYCVPIWLLPQLGLACGCYGNYKQINNSHNASSDMQHDLL